MKNEEQNMRDTEALIREKSYEELSASDLAQLGGICPDKASFNRLKAILTADLNAMPHDKEGLETLRRSLNNHPLLKSRTANYRVGFWLAAASLVLFAATWMLFNKAGDPVVKQADKTAPVQTSPQLSPGHPEEASVPKEKKEREAFIMPYQAPVLEQLKERGVDADAAAVSLSVSMEEEDDMLDLLVTSL
jgi:hypothetical protein